MRLVDAQRIEIFGLPSVGGGGSSETEDTGVLQALALDPERMILCKHAHRVGAGELDAFVVFVLSATVLDAVHASNVRSTRAINLGAHSSCYAS